LYVNRNAESEVTDIHAVLVRKDGSAFINEGVPIKKKAKKGIEMKELTYTTHCLCQTERTMVRKTTRVILLTAWLKL
jgi:hypothetical protein